MGRRGPQPLPANVHLLRGNPSHKPIGELVDGFQPAVGQPVCPSHLSAAAKREWNRVVPWLERYNLVDELSRAPLAIYCQAWADLVYHQEILDRAVRDAKAKRAACEKAGKVYEGGDGSTVTTPNGHTQYSPHWVMRNRAADQVEKFRQAFPIGPDVWAKFTPSTNLQGDLFPDPAAGDQGGFDSL